MLIHPKAGALKVRYVSRDQGMPHHLTRVAAVRETLFFASETEGVTILAKGAKKQFTDPVHLPEAWILDVAPITGKRFWAATCQSGVAYVNGDRMVLVDKKTGLADNCTIAVTPYRHGAFVATLGGLSRVSEKGRAEPITPPTALSGIREALPFIWTATPSGTAPNPALFVFG